MKLWCIEWVHSFIVYVHQLIAPLGDNSTEFRTADWLCPQQLHSDSTLQFCQWEKTLCSSHWFCWLLRQGLYNEDKCLPKTYPDIAMLGIQTHFHEDFYSKEQFFWSERCRMHLLLLHCRGLFLLYPFWLLGKRSLGSSLVVLLCLFGLSRHWRLLLQLYISKCIIFLITIAGR